MTHLLNDEVVETVEGSVLEKLIEHLTINKLLGTLAGAVGRLELLGSGGGNKDLVAGHVAGSGMVLGVRDAP